MTNEATIEPPTASRTPTEWKELGNEAFADQDFPKAIKCYTAAIQLDSSNHVYFSNRSASHGGLENWQEAAADAKECIRLDPSFVKGYYRLATALIELKDYNGAQKTVRQGLSADQNNPQLQKQMRTIKQLQKAAEQKNKKLNRSKKMADSAAATAAMAARTPSTATLDAATSRELQDLKMQFQATSKELSTVQANLVKAQREFKVSELTKSELEEMKHNPSDQGLYRSIGKMFLLQSKENIITFLENQMKEHRKTEKDMTQKTEYLERRIKSTRQNMEELLASAR